MLIGFLLKLHMIVGKLSHWFLISWGRKANVFNKQQFRCFFTDHSLSTITYWTKWQSMPPSGMTICDWVKDQEYIVEKFHR